MPGCQHKNRRLNTSLADFFENRHSVDNWQHYIQDYKIIWLIFSQEKAVFAVVCNVYCISLFTESLFDYVSKRFFVFNNQYAHKNIICFYHVCLQQVFSKIPGKSVYEMIDYMKMNANASLIGSYVLL